MTKRNNTVSEKEKEYKDSIRRLENEVKMFKIMSSKHEENPVDNDDDVFMDADDISDNSDLEPSPHEKIQNIMNDLEFDDASHLSALSNDVSVASVASKVWSVISDASSILCGITPKGNEDINQISMILEEGEYEIDTEADGGQIRRSTGSVSVRSNRSSDGRIDFLKDDKSQMTFGRIFALSLMNKTWYNPSLTLLKNKDAKEAPPSLEKAWAYFEHITLPRHIYKPEAGRFKSKDLEFARPGEDHRETRLYHPFFTHLHQMGDFGLGMGIYFTSLMFLIVLTFIAGLISIPNIIHYKSHGYSQGQVGVRLMLQGSAVCTDTSWVPCPTCEFNQYPQSLIRKSTDGLIFVRKNNCTAPPFTEGMLNLSVVVLMIVGFWAMNKLQSRMTVKFDMDEQTAQDYSIQISNPPSNANDPEEWKKFFEDQFPDAHVTCCTICVNNDHLLQDLVKLRECRNQIKRMLPPGTEMDDKTLALLAAKCKNSRSGIPYLLSLFHPFGLFLDIAALYNKVIVLTAEIKGLSQLDNPVTSLFITFETEKAQREILSTLCVSKSDALRNNKNALKDKKHIFRGKHVLEIIEPDEPSTIRWSNLNAEFFLSVKALCITSVLTFLTILFAAWIIKVTNDAYGYFWTSLVIAGLNVIFPLVSKMVTEVEPHKSETSYQTSLFVKIAIFRYVNTAIVINVITPFVRTLGGTASAYDTDTDALIPMVYSIFFADVVTSNLLAFFDPMGHVQRHFLGPRQFNQDFMNMKFKGSLVMLAERYTNMTKIVFHGFYYNTLFPAAFFMSSAALFVNYYVDKFSVMRTWAKAPKTGTAIGRINVLFILPLSVLAMVLLSSYWWSGFPYDNLCANGVINSTYVGVHYVDITRKNNPELFVFGSNTTSYQYCNQNLFNPDNGQVRYPALPHWQYVSNSGKWMTKDQELVTQIFGWASVCVFAIILVRFAWFAKKYFVSLFRPSYKSVGDDKNINFSSVEGISCYIPEVVSAEFSYPLVASSVDGLDTSLFEWKDPDRPHDFYNIVQDAKEILYGKDSNEVLPANVFSKVYHYPPKTARAKM